MKHLFQILLLFVVLGLAACSNNDAPVVEEDNSVLTSLSFNEAESRAAASIQSFNSNFFKAVVAAEGTKENVVCSPLSTAMMLSMMANGVDTEVQVEIANALGCNDVEALNSISSKYLSILPKVDKDVKFTAANSVWYNKDFTIASTFSNTMDKYFAAPTNARNFTSNQQALVAEINDWCSESTNGIIKKIISEIPAGLNALMADAVYFKGAWAKPFEKSATVEAQFHGVNSAATVDMMHQNEAMPYVATADYKAVKIQFGKGQFLAMFILPNDDINSFIARADFSEIMEEPASVRAVDLHFPRFSYTPGGELQLNKALVGLGIESFDKQSNLTMFTPAQKAQHQIIQKVGIEFNEDGCEAATVTANGIYTSAGVGTSVELKFDRPFVFLIRETTTGAMLFAGKISEL